MRRSISLALTAAIVAAPGFAALPAHAAPAQGQARASAGTPARPIPAGWAPAGRGSAEAASAGPCRPGQRANLRGRDFTGGAQLPSSLRCADLTGAKLDGQQLTQKDLTGSILRDASLKEADLTQATLKYADLRGANLTEADLGQVRADHADLRGAILIDAEAGQAEFPYADLSGAKLTRAELTQVEFTSAKLVGADLTESTPGQLKARKADFTRAKLREAPLTQANLRNAVFVDADLTEAEFTMAELAGADFTGATVEKASFTMADDANLEGAKGTPTGLAGLPTSFPTSLPLGGEEAPEDEPSTAAAPDQGGGISVGLVMVVLSAVGLAVTVVAWGVSAQRRTRRNARFTLMRRGAEEDITRLGEEIDRLDYEFQISGRGGMTADHDWRQALDAYEAAKNALVMARREQDLHLVARAVQDGRNALGRLRGRVR
ncbi:pentapeptide repeat-containing protein [Planomonospora sp. ID91781]|uniref:pentapeptide repeat-containing protein n=1 Tax=Planomonospora sp. ID91781 TaxID=2738135 RepID=UPI0018C3B058|nr:pentapeptide repeat-containing protein [Planomonospora sp. ID91781]MBG0820836.1 pentapeptide repeat-containing protein [Planomonospora sp. ID91781]